MVVLQARDKGGLTALFWAIRHDRLKAAVVLLDRGAHIDCKDRDGYTPLIWAASTGLAAMHTYTLWDFIRYFFCTYAQLRKDS